MKISKTNLILVFILILAFVLRFMAAGNLDVNPDEMVYTLFPLNIISAGRLSTIEQAPLFFYLTDLGYQAFGFSPITARLPSIVFGSLAVLLIFLIAQEMFNNKKISLLSSFLLAVSGYAITYNVEMDITAFFFILLSIYFFMRFIKAGNKNIYLSALFLGMAVMSKPLVVFLVLVYPVFYVIYSNKHPAKAIVRKQEGKYLLNKKLTKTIIVAVLILMLSLAPILVYNYLLYKEKGITDYYFATFAKAGDNIYSSLGGQKPWGWQRFTTTSKNKLGEFLKLDFPLVILGLLGLVLCLTKKRGWRRKHNWAYFFLLAAAPLWIYLTGRTGSGSHYVIFLMILSLFAGVPIFLLHKVLKKEYDFKNAIGLISAVILVTSIIVLNGTLTEHSTIVNLREFAATMPNEAVVVVDPLIYTGITAWALNDKHYLSGQQFPALLEQLQTAPEPTVTVPVYYVQCGRNSKCGWKPEDYERALPFSDQISAYFQERLTLLEEIKGSDVLVFPVYAGEMQIHPAVYEAIDRTHSFYFYPVGWKYTENVIDNYTPKTTLDRILNKFGFSVLYIELALAFGAIFLAVCLPWKRFG